MAQNLVIESPSFDYIRRDAGRHTEDAVRLLWVVLNEEIRSRRSADRILRDKIEGKALSAAPSVNQNNFDTEGALLVLFTGADSVSVTGIRNGVEGRVLILHVVGAGTITTVNASASSDETNRIVNNAGANVTIATDESQLLLYLNSRWREVALAV